MFTERIGIESGFGLLPLIRGYSLRWIRVKIAHLCTTHLILLTEVDLVSKTWDIQAAHPPQYSLQFIFLSPVYI